MTKPKKKKIIKKNHYITLISLTLIIITILLSIGWSAFDSTMTMDSYAFVRIPSEVRVTGFSLYSVSNGGTGLYEDYNVHLGTANASFPNVNSTITYEVKVTNIQIPSGTAMGILSATGLPSNLTILSWSGYNLGDKICDDTDPTDCGSGVTKTFYITIGYKDAQSYDPNNTSYVFDVNFDFREFHDITYVNIAGNYPSGVFDGEDLEISLNNISSLELEVSGSGEYIEGIDYTYSGGNLVINDIEENLTIRKLPSYTITYNANGGSFYNNETTNPVSYVWRYNRNNVLSGAELIPTYNSYVLFKWYDETSFQNEFDITREITASKNVYARWVDAVVEMNGEFYNSITTALSHITDNTVVTTINLLKNTTENFSIDTGQKVLLNLQNHIINNSTSAALITVSGELSVTNGTLISNSTQNGAVNVNATGEFNLLNVNLSLSNSGGKQAIYSYGKVKIEGTSEITSSSRSRATVQMLSSGTLEVLGGTILATGTKSAVEAHANATVTIGYEDGNIDINCITIQGEDYGIIANFDFYDGTIKGRNGAISPTLGVGDTEDNFGVVTTTERIGNYDYEVARLLTANVVTFDANGGTLLETERSVQNGNQVGTLPTPSRGGYVFTGWYTDPDNGSLVTSSYIVNGDVTLWAHWSQEYSAQIGQTYYYSVQDAVNAATNNVTTTVLLIRDVSEAVNITQRKRIELDLQGYTLSFNGAAAAIECYGKLYVYNGAITSASQTNSSINIRSGGDATIEDVDILSTGSRQAVYNYGGGKVTITGNSYISSRTTGSANNSPIERGTVQNLSQGTLIITGGTIVGINQQAISNEGTMTIGTDDGVINNSDIEIIGKTYGIKSLSTFNFYDGAAKGQTAGISGSFNQASGLSTAQGYEIIDNYPYYTEYVIAN